MKQAILIILAISVFAVVGVLALGRSGFELNRTQIGDETGVENAIPGENEVGVANPAAEYCEEQDGVYLTEEEAQSGQSECELESGETCDAWTYFRTRECVDPALVDSDQERLAEALMNKHPEWQGEDLVVEVRENTGEYATGSVNFQDAMAGGGMFLAHKLSGEWQIVWDGNGSVMCEDVEGHEFPQSMVSECYDAMSGEMRQL